MSYEIFFMEKFSIFSSDPPKIIKNFKIQLQKRSDFTLVNSKF